MTYSKTEITKVRLAQNYKVEYERKEILGGLIWWWIEIKRDCISKDLIIKTTEKFDNVIVNEKNITS